MTANQGVLLGNIYHNQVKYALDVLFKENYFTL